MDPLHPLPGLSGRAGESRPDDRALRDAEEILTRAQEDDAAAAVARARYRTHRMPSLPHDERIRPLLAPRERVLAVRDSARAERRQPSPGTHPIGGLTGSLYVTSCRLILVGRITLAYDLETIDEAVLSGERLLLVFRDGQGLTLEVAQPRLLRVELSAARTAARV